MKWVFLCLLILLVFWFIWNKISQIRVVNLFKRGSVSVGGQRGCGKDMLFEFVVNKRKRNYISNVRYSSPKKSYQWIPVDFKAWDINGNTYEDLRNGKCLPYVYPYPDNIDYYISDGGVIFPSQYDNELDKKFKSAPLFLALSRHLGVCNVHYNSQNIARVWKKMREQSEIFIVCVSCRVIFGRWCRQVIRYYNNRESAEKAIRVPRFGLGKMAKQARYNFEIAHGYIKTIRFWHKIRYRYDSRRFKSILEKGCIDYENA